MEIEEAPGVSESDSELRPTLARRAGCEREQTKPPATGSNNGTSVSSKRKFTLHTRVMLPERALIHAQ
jgi:hypothetical protein